MSCTVTIRTANWINIFTVAAKFALLWDTLVLGYEKK